MFPLVVPGPGGFDGRHWAGGYGLGSGEQGPSCGNIGVGSRQPRGRAPAQPRNV